MRLCFDPVMCPKAVLPAALNIAKVAGFDAMVLHCAFTASSPFHPDASVRLIRYYFDDMDVIRTLKANGYEGPVVLNTVGGSVADLRVRVEEILNT